MAILRNFSFIIDGVLAGSAHPLHAMRSAQELRAFLAEQGVGGVVSLDERGLPRDWLDLAAVSYLHLAVQDFQPPTLDQIQRFVSYVDSIRRQGQATLAHCHAGIGRTGTMLACYLVKDRAMNADAAIDFVRQMRPGSIETWDQEEAVRAYERSLKAQ